jgi:hypothetical protein
VSHVVAVVHRSDGELVPEGRSVLSVVAYLDGDRFLVFDRRRERVDHLGVGLGALEKPRIPSENLFAGVSRVAFPGAVDVDERVVGKVRITEAESDRCLVDGAFDVFEARFVVGDVLLGLGHAVSRTHRGDVVDEPVDRTGAVLPKDPVGTVLVGGSRDLLAVLGGEQNDGNVGFRLVERLEQRDAVVTRKVVLADETIERAGRGLRHPGRGGVNRRHVEPLGFES